MSFERVRNFIKRHAEETFVCVVNGRAKCMAAASKKADRIMRESKSNVVVVGVYSRDCPENWLAQDLFEAGVEV